MRKERKNRSENTNTYRYDSSKSAVAAKTTEKFMLYLKEYLDYDEVAIYTYDDIGTSTDMRIIEKAISFIMNAREPNFNDIEAYDFFRQTVLDSSDVIKVVKLTRFYERKIDEHYLFISSYFKDNNDFKIIIPIKLNYLPLLKVKCMTGLDTLHVPDNFKKYSKSSNVDGYSDCYGYIEFREDPDISLNSLDFIFEINMDVNEYPPILQHAVVSKFNPVSHERKAQIVVRLYTEDTKYKFDYLVDVRLIFKNDIIKQCVFKELEIDDIKKVIRQFIFPLTERFQDLEDSDLSPELTSKFMSKNYDDYWQIKQMVQI